MRAFLALDLPDEVCAALERLQDALPVGHHILPEDMHLTLAFFERAALDQLDELHLSLEMAQPPLLSLSLHGLGLFGSDPPRSLHAHARGAGLLAYQKKIATTARRAGLTLPHLRFVPHITLARFPRRIGPDDMARIGRFLSARADFTWPAFAPPALDLYQSTLSKDGARYDLLARYPFFAIDPG